MFDSTKQKSAELKDEMVRRAAHGAAQGAERVAVETQKAADSVQTWAKSVERSTRSRTRVYVGLGILAALVALVAYLMKSKGEKYQNQLQEIGEEARDRVG